MNWNYNTLNDIADCTSNRVMCHISKLYYKVHFHSTGWLDSAAKNWTPKPTLLKTSNGESSCFIHNRFISSFMTHQI